MRWQQLWRYRGGCTLVMSAPEMATAVVLLPREHISKECPWDGNSCLMATGLVPWWWQSAVCIIMHMANLTARLMGPLCKSITHCTVCLNCHAWNRWYALMIEFFHFTFYSCAYFLYLILSRWYSSCIHLNSYWTVYCDTTDLIIISNLWIKLVSWRIS